MNERSEYREIGTEDLRLLAYLQHMARTARSDSAKRLCELFARHEQGRMEANDGIRLSEARRENGGEQMPMKSISAEEGVSPLGPSPEWYGGGFQRVD